MRDFDVIQHEFLGGCDIQIVPIYDVHLGNPFCMEKEFISFIKETKETPNRYLIIGGDLIENGTRSSVGDSIFEQTLTPAEQKEEAIHILEPVKDRIICLLRGNHEGRSKKDAGLCPMFDIAAKLGLEHLYRPNVAFIDIRLGDVTQVGYRPDYTIVALHGSGGGALSGSALNRNERFGYVIDGVDIIITGHVHKPLTSQPQKIKFDRYRKTVSFVPFRTVTSSAWLKYGGYAAEKMLTPASHCIQTITLSYPKKNITVTM